MRKVILQLMTTLDGFFAGPGGEADWHLVDDEFNKYVEDTSEPFVRGMYCFVIERPSNCRR